MKFNWETLSQFFPSGIVLIATILIILGTRFLINKIYKGKEGFNFRKQIFTFIIIIISLFSLILTIPVDNELKEQVLKIFGLILSAVIAFSSTTVLSNLIAGLMLRAMKNFRPGDFISVSEYFGRVTELGLYHVEIQTINRNLITIPSSYLLKHPIDVTRSSGTYVQAEVSLGYDIPRDQIEQSLIQAAKQAELSDPFVQVINLGNHAVTYRVYGFLEEVKNLITARSQLKKEILDVLHGSNIEIVSPDFVNRRVFDENKKFIPDVSHIDRDDKSEGQNNEEEVQEKAFDKADEAESLFNLKQKLEDIESEINELREKKNDKTDDGSDIKDKIAQKQSRKKKLQELISREEEEKD